MVEKIINEFKKKGYIVYSIFKMTPYLFIVSIENAEDKFNNLFYYNSEDNSIIRCNKSAKDLMYYDKLFSKSNIG